MISEVEGPNSCVYQDKKMLTLNPNAMAMPDWFPDW